MTIEPRPMLMSANPWNCAISPPASATSPFESARPSTFITLMLIPCALLISGLHPVARIADPISVPKNQYSTAITAAARITPTRMAVGTKRDDRISGNLSTLTGLFAMNPMIARLIEYSANCVRIPARMAGMPSAVCRSPVHSPASRPAASAASSAAQGFHPPRISMTATAPPVVNVPSTVRSATSNNRNVIYTPSAIIPQIRPCAMPAGIFPSRTSGLSDAKYAAISTPSPMPISRAAFLAAPAGEMPEWAFFRIGTLVPAAPMSV